MEFQRNNHGKRSHSHLDYSDNVGSKRRHPGDEKDSYTTGTDDTVYRYLCSGKKIGSIIGRGGDIIKQIRSDTRAKIQIRDSVPGCEERVITIISTSKETNTLENTGVQVCPAQDALFRVHDRLVNDDTMGDEESDRGSSQVTVRFLVPSDQIGCIIGKGGQIIQGIRNDSGANVRVLKSEHLPACAISGDELVLVSGEPSVVKSALLQVSTRLRDNPSRSPHILSFNAPPIHSEGVRGVGPTIRSYGGFKGEADGDWPSFYPPPRDDNSAKEFILRMLCLNANVGGVIGKGGVIIKQIRQESGAYIKVDSANAEDDCVITISAKEFFEDPVSPTIDAAVRLQPRSSEKTERESGEPSYVTRILVPKSQIGCLIGKGGSIISEMRRTTRANIRILSNENLPRVASGDDEMVQISGDLDTARDALIQMASRLKANFFARKNTSMDMPESPNYGDRDTKLHSRGHSYSGGYGDSSDLHPSDSYGSYGGSQSGGGSYGSYGGYSSRLPSSGLSGSNHVSHGKHHGY